MFYKIEDKTMDRIASEIDSEYVGAGKLLKRLIRDKKGEIETYMNVIK